MASSVATGVANGASSAATGLVNGAKALPGAIEQGADVMGKTAVAMNNVADAVNNTANSATVLGKAGKNLYNAASAVSGALPLVVTTAAVLAAGEPPRYNKRRGVTRNYFGGDETADPAKGLREYESSISASTKENVIRRLARALKRAGIDVDAEGDLDDIVRQLVTQIPNPKNGKTFANDAKSQEKVCRVIADVLNDEFTPGVSKASEKFIDTSLSAVEMCRTVGEWAHSFSAGVNTEFLAVHASVRNALRTVEILAEIMKELYDKIRLEVETYGDSKLTRRFDPLNEVYIRAQRERKRQEELLKNILHVQLAPAAKELEIAMRDESEQNALVKRLGLKPGTADFADSLAMAISGLGTSASIAQRVNKALKLVGFSVKQYLESGDFAEFQALLDTQLEDGKIPAKDLAKFLEAVETLQHSFIQKDDSRFRMALMEATGGRHHEGGDDVYDDDDKRTKVQKRVETRETEKKVILRDFAKRMARHYDELLTAVKSIGPKLGREIPLTDKTDNLNEALKRLSALSNTNNRIELALIGMFMGAEARERKERFVNSLRMVSVTCSSIMELEMYRATSSYFARLKTAIDAIEKTIDYFADVIKSKYGVDGGDHEVKGGAPVDLADYLPEIASSGLSFNEAVGEFTYYYYVAKVHVNLEQTSKELDTYGEKYVELLGDAVASRIYSLSLERKAIIERLTPLNPKTVVGAWRAPFTNDEHGIAKYTAALKWVDDEYDTKNKFYNALQAVDLYLKAFTIALTKDPDAVRDIKNMLDGTQVIARWFSEQTGNSIWQAFEQMNSVDDNGDIHETTSEHKMVSTDDTSHYYEQIKKRELAGVPVSSLYGVPQYAINCGDSGPMVPAVKAKKFISDSIDQFQALKNLINAFARIGDKFGGRELRTQIFMSPSQIFKNLSDYIKQSAMSINCKGVTGSDVPVDMNYPNFTGGDVADAVPAWSVFFGSVGTLHGNYQIEDDYFALIIKGMAAKILTTLGVYDMFERTSPVYSLTPTRIIVGGADDFAVPEVFEGAAELYFRLPRLAEFYRQFLRWDVNNDTDANKIAMLPELEGIFSGLIRLIFQKAVVASVNGDYSDSEMRALVRESNLIYDHFREKHADRAPQEALSAFVMEINRRYGIIKRKDMQDYMTMVKKFRSEAEYGNYNNTSYAILPGEGDVEVNRHPPSDYFKVQGDAAAAASPYTRRIGLDHQGSAPPLGVDGIGRKRMLREFRAKFDAQFSSIAASTFNHTSYALLIKQAAREIQSAQNRESKFLIATKLIQGTSISGTDSNKAVMFHETVIVGLNVLSSFETLLRNYNNSVESMDPCIIGNAIMDAVYARALTGVAVGVDAPAPANKASLQTLMLTNSTPVGTVNGTTIYDMYIVSNDIRTFAGRNNMPLNALPADVYTFLNNEYIVFAAVINALLAAGIANTIPQVIKPSDIEDIGNLVLNARDGTRIAADNTIVAVKRFLRVLRLVARLLVDHNKIMENFVENLFDLMSGSKNSDSNQALVEVRMDYSIGIQLSFAKLREIIEKLMADVKHFFEIFRTSIPRETIDRFEKSTEAGSIYWIEKNLIDVFFRGTVSDAMENNTLEGLARRVTKIYSNLIRNTKVSLTGCNHANLSSANADPPNPAGPNRLSCIPVVGPANDITLYETYGQAISALVFYNAIDNTSSTNVDAPGALTDGADAISTLISTDRTLPSPQINGTAALRFPLYRPNDKGMRPQRSLLFAYNQLIASYLTTLTDTAGGKRIYLNLINAFANGVASRSVTNPQGAAFPDLSVTGTTFGFRGDPVAQAVLFQSLAYIFQRLLKDVSPTTQVPDHLVTTLTDVPIFMKEAMRCNLPAYIKYFDILAQKSDFIKSLIQKTSIDISRPSQVDIATAAVAVRGVLFRADSKIHSNNVATTNNPGSYLPNALDALNVLSLAMRNEEMAARISPIIDAIVAGAFAISSSASETLKELGDTPVYFQTQENSIEQYRMRYGKMPLMPLSISLYFLNDLVVPPGTQLPDDHKLFPGHVLGTPEFKLLYGTRQLTMRSTPVVFDQMPGVKALLDSYNGVSGRQEQIDDNRYLPFVQTTVSALRYITEARNIKSSLSGYNLFSSKTFINGVGNTTNGITKYVRESSSSTFATGNAAFSITSPHLSTDINFVLNLVESSNQDEELCKITDRVGRSTGRLGNIRDHERIHNIIDMNIIPINVHALMRDTPLANLYNYEYTFEQMIASIYGEQASRYIKEGTDNNSINDTTTKNSRQMLLRLMVRPYMNVTSNLYGSEVDDVGSAGFVHRMFRGDNNLGMGRPKFLSDQLFNKALFGSIYQSSVDFDEAGPSVGIGVARGRAVVSNPISNCMHALSDIIRDFTQSSREIARYLVDVAGARRYINENPTLESNINQAWAYINSIGALLRSVPSDNTVPLDQAYIAQLISYETEPAIATSLITFAISGVDDVKDLYYHLKNLRPDDADWLNAFNAVSDAITVIVGAITTLRADMQSIRPIQDMLNKLILSNQDLPNKQRTHPSMLASSRRAAHLTYLKSESNTDEDTGAAIVEISIPNQLKRKLEWIGKSRFDTRFIRNIFFITNVVRILRLKLNRELSQSRNVLVSSHMSVAAGITEYGSDPFGPNEVYNSNMLNGESRYNDGMPL